MEKDQYTNIKTFCYKVYSCTNFKFFSNFHWTDTTQGYRAYSRKIFEDRLISPFRNIFNSYELLCYFSYKIPRLGYRCMNASIRTYYKDANPSKISGLSNHFLILKILINTCLGLYVQNKKLIIINKLNFILINLLSIFYLK